MESIPRSKEAGLKIEEVYSSLETRRQGLTQSEAEERLGRFGTNTISEIKGKPIYLRLLGNFTHLMAILLWMGGIVGFVAQLPQLGIAIWAVNIINGTFSFWQEYRAEKATEALRRLMPTYARVLRDGEEQRIPAADLVPGDVILLSEGDHISADARIVQEAELRVDQSTLTGESHTLRKTSEVVRQEGLSYIEVPNLLFSGTTVASGTGRAVVFATGMHSEFGKIAHLTQTVVEEPSPLQKELNRTTKVITVLAVSIGLAFFLLAILMARVSLAASFVFAMGMIVAFVPEGMLPTVTLSLAMGVQRMARRNALIKKLSVVETLGCTTVICTDKTGTLTQNEMTVSDIWLHGRRLKITGIGYSPEGEITDHGHTVTTSTDLCLSSLLKAAGLCNNARLLSPAVEGDRWRVLGDPTEAALLVAGLKAGLDLGVAERDLPRVRELPFDSRRKRMSTIHRVPYPGNGIVPESLVVYTKGAPRETLALCTHIETGDGPRPLDDTLRAQITAANDEYARNGLRVLAVAERNIAHRPRSRRPGGEQSDVTECSPENIECDLIFLGLVAMADPPRPEVTAAVDKCQSAGIRIIMITGDYGLTAESIARRIGIIRGERPRIVAGADLDLMDEPALMSVLDTEVIFARVAPEHKLRVVGALQEMGHVVAVTGDGVNDAPALKKADIGVAMGIAGTDVAKEAADMVVTDDNFASIVSAVEEGRAVYANIRKFAVYVFNSNMAEAVPFIAMLFSRGAIPLPLTVMQVLSVDLGTDMVPAIGLGSEPPEAGIMDRPPRSRKERLLSTSLLARALLWYGMIESIAAMSAYFFMNWVNGWPAAPLASSGISYRMATTMTLAGVVATQVGAVFACRTDRSSIFKIGFFTNRLVLLGIAVELMLLGLLMYVPFLQDLFNTAPIGLTGWVFVFAWTPVIVLADELRKAIVRHKEKPVPGGAI